jgi:hypothetical protein
MVTTITVDPAIRDRLKTFGHAGMTYNEILTRMMDEIEREGFVAELRRQVSAAQEKDWVDLEDVDGEEGPPARGKRR